MLVYTTRRDNNEKTSNGESIEYRCDGKEDSKRSLSGLLVRSISRIPIESTWTQGGMRDRTYAACK